MGTITLLLSFFLVGKPTLAQDPGMANLTLHWDQTPLLIDLGPRPRLNLRIENGTTKLWEYDLDPSRGYARFQRLVPAGELTIEIVFPNGTHASQTIDLHAGETVVHKLNIPDRRTAIAFRESKARILPAVEKDRLGLFYLDHRRPRPKSLVLESVASPWAEVIDYHEAQFARSKTDQIDLGAEALTSRPIRYFPSPKGSVYAYSALSAERLDRTRLPTDANGVYLVDVTPIDVLSRGSFFTQALSVRESSNILLHDGTETEGGRSFGFEPEGLARVSSDRPGSISALGGLRYRSYDRSGSTYDHDLLEREIHLMRLHCRALYL